MGPMRPLVVYVEDEPSVARLVRFWLEEAGYDVRTAADGAQGLAVIRDCRPAVVITDALMPVMTGDELVAALSGDPELGGIPILMATAAATPARERRMRALGCRAVLAKPLDEATLLAAVAEALAPAL